MMNKQALTVFVAAIFLVANVGVSRQNTDDCEQAGLPLNHLCEYQNIVQEIAKNSCALISNSSFGKGRVYHNSSLPSNNLKLSNIFQSLSATCRRYTDILAFKDQLQKVLFDSNETLSNETLLQLTSLIINLQTAAKNLQHIEKNQQSFEIKQHNRYCVTFTSSQYELMYFSRLHKSDIASSLCTKAKVLRNKTEACKNWKNYN